MSDGGKGSAPRPFTVDPKRFSDNWARIFGKAPKTFTVTVPADLSKAQPESTDDQEA